MRVDRLCARRLWCGGRTHRPLLDDRAGDGRRSPAPESLAWQRSRRPDSFPRTIRALCSSSSSCRAARRSARTSEVDARRPRRSCKEEPAVDDVTSVIGLNFIDNYSQPNAGLHGRHPQAVRGAQGPIAGRARRDRAARAEIPADPGRHRRSAGAAADPRSRHRRRLHLCA